MNWLKNNNVEPTTKKYLEARLLYPNLGLKTLIEQFRGENPWIDFDEKEVNIEEVEF